MRHFNDIEKFVRRGKLSVKIGEQMDKRTLRDSYAAMKETIESTSPGYEASMFRFAVRNRVTRLLAAAAVIIVVLSIFLSRGKLTPVEPPTEPPPVSQSPARIISMMSMRMTYQQGGFDALDKQFRDTLDVLGPRSSNISMRDLIEGLNGS